MTKSSASEIKREKKKSFYLRELSAFVDRIAEEQPAIREVYISRVDLSADGGICYLYFAAISSSQVEDNTPEKIYAAALNVLKLYKPSMRKSLAGILQSRYTPDLLFLFDAKREKIDRINTLLDQVHHDLAATDEGEQ